MVLENSFRDVLSFIGPAKSRPSLSENSVFQHILLRAGTLVIFSADLTLDREDTNICVGRNVGEVEMNAFVTEITNNPEMMHRRDIMSCFCCVRINVARQNNRRAGYTSREQLVFSLLALHSYFPATSQFQY